MSIADLRKDYTRASLNETDVAASPFAQFHHWFEEALNAELPEPNAMTVATVTPDGKPAARILLIKGVDERGFVFFTNYESRKGAELSATPHAALLFHWVELERQVRIEGRVEKISDQESDDYFNSRPLGSRLGAWASPQSQVVTSREALENNLMAVQQLHGDQPKRPPHWGGYRVVPSYFEFWQGRPSRLHDRIAYTLNAQGEWGITRLAP